MASKAGHGVSRAPVNLDRLIMVGIPTFGAVSVEWHANMMRLDQPFNRKALFNYKKGLEVGIARNAIVKEMLEYVGPLGERFSHVWFIDDDTIVPPNTLVRLLTHRAPIVGGLYWARVDPPYPVLSIHEDQGDVAEFTPGEVVSCLNCGMGCTLIAREVFETLEAPWYRTIPVHQRDPIARVGSDFGLTEDSYFYQQARKAGIPILCDTSIACWHYDMQQRQGYPKDAWDRGDVWPFTPASVPEQEVNHAG